MKECFVKTECLSEAYHRALIELYNEGEVSECSDWNQKQKECSMTIVIEKPLKEPMISKLFIGGPRELEQYRQEILDGILDFEVEKGNWAYTYHDRMINYPIDNVNLPHVYWLNQIDFVINELKRNQSSRRAVILVRNPSEDAFSDDPACLQHIQYFIRNNKLHCKVLFRSNDACKANFMNMFAFILLQEKIAKELDIEVGSYTHRANSFHCYEKDFEMLEGYVNRIYKAECMYDISYDYKEDWEEMMEMYKPEIKQQVDILKES